MVTSSNTFIRHYKVGFYFASLSYFRCWQNKLFLSWHWVLSCCTFVHSKHGSLEVFWFCVFIRLFLLYLVDLICASCWKKAVEKLPYYWWPFYSLSPFAKNNRSNLSPSQSSHLEITPQNSVTKHEFILILVKIPFHSARRATRKKGNQTILNLPQC